MKCFVTGGTGFIGTNLVNKLIDIDYEVHVIDNKIENRSLNEKATYHNIDLSCFKSVKSIKNHFKNTDIIFHLAAKARVQPSINDPVSYEKNNNLSTMNILKIAVDFKVKRLIYSSSSSVYGNNKNMPLKESMIPNPLSPYGAQKYYGEILCKTFSQVYDIETVSLRYFNVYGEGQSIGGAYSLVIGIFLDQFRKGIPLTIRGDGSQKRDFTYVGDVVSANILAAQSKNVGKGNVINIGNGNNTSINEIAGYIGGKKLYIDPVVEPFETLADISLAKSLLNWKPTMEVKSWIENMGKE